MFIGGNGGKKLTHPQKIGHHFVTASFSFFIKLQKMKSYHNMVGNIPFILEISRFSQNILQFQIFFTFDSFLLTMGIFGTNFTLPLGPSPMPTYAKEKHFSSSLSLQHQSCAILKGSHTKKGNRGGKEVATILKRY